MIFTPLLTATYQSTQKSSAIAIIPRPVSMKVEEGSFSLNSSSKVIAGPGCHSLANDVRMYLSHGTGFDLFNAVNGKKNVIRLEIDPKLPHGSESYILNVNPNEITITGGGAAGVFYGIETLRQLLPAHTFAPINLISEPDQIPCLHIEDYPRFGWRGAHLDVGRHFMPKDFILKFLDLMAMHKLNSFHWHLTEDQGWRIEIKKYPKLTSVGAWRANSMTSYDPPKFDDRTHGGFYTQEEIRQVVQYAKERFINIVPEIEMPGHAQAAVASYPELGNTDSTGFDPNPQVLYNYGVSGDTLNLQPPTVQFCKDVLTEVMALFPSKFIHLGGDEAPTSQWETSPTAQKLMQSLGIKKARGLQSWFTNQMDTFLIQHGRRMIGWDEILEGGKLASSATVMSWRGEDGGIAAAKSDHDVIMAPDGSTYLDHYQSRDIELEPHAIGGLLTLNDVYNYEPIPAAMNSSDAKHVLGAQTQIWTEYIPDPKHVEYMAYPRMTAFSEVVWSPKVGKNYDDFLSRLKIHLKRLDALGVNYRRLDPPTVTLANWKSGATANKSISLSFGLISSNSKSVTDPIRIGIFNLTGPGLKKVTEFTAVVNGKSISLVQSPKSPEIWSLTLPSDLNIAEGKTIPPADTFGNLSISLNLKFSLDDNGNGTGEIRLLPDSTVYHPFTQGSP